MSLMETLQWYLANIWDYFPQMLPCMCIALTLFLLLRPFRLKRLARMNLLRSELTAAILEALEEADVSDIQVPLGSLFDLEPLWAKGPALKARAMTVGTVRAEFDSQLTSAGVNQTLHRIGMEVTVPMTLLLPGGEVEVPLDTRLWVAETVIVGQVPDTYLQLDGIL